MSLPTTIKAIKFTKPGGPEVLSLANWPMPQPSKGEVLIKVSAAGVNRPDVAQRQGTYPPPPGASDIPGLEIAGKIIAGDVNNSGFNIGDNVCALVTGGGYAEYCVAPIEQCLPIPKGLSNIEAAGLPETFFTVWSNVFDRGRLAPNESLLVHGGASGIGTTAIQLAKAMGHTVYATAGSDNRAQAVERLGAALCINYREQDFVAEIKKATDGKGVNIILDMVAGSYVNRNIECLAHDGRLVIIALLGGAKSEINCAQVLVKRLTITGSTLRARSVDFKSGIAQSLKQHVWPLLESKQVKPIIHATFPLEQAAQAHAMMDAGEQIGKIILTI